MGPSAARECTEGEGHEHRPPVIARIAFGGRKVQASLAYLSATGCLIEGSHPFPMGEVLAIDLPCSGPAQVIMVWRRGNCVVGNFAEPLSVSALMLILAEAPFLPQPFASAVYR